MEVALDPSELELDPEAVAARYERQIREQRPKGREDLSDMLADHVARQKVSEAHTGVMDKISYAGFTRRVKRASAGSYQLGAYHAARRE